MIVFGIDMGTKSACLSVLSFRKTLLSRKIMFDLVKCEMFPLSLTGMSAAELEKDIIFIEYFTKAIDQHRPLISSPELFMARSFRSNLGMPISYMIGLMRMICKEKKVVQTPLMPASWKLALKKNVCAVDDLYDKSYPVKKRIPNHAIDATLIALYHATKGYKCITLKQVQRLLGQLEKRFTFPPPLPAAGKKKKRAKKRKVKSPKK